MSGIKNGIAVLIVSCDSYSDLWPAFFDCFRRFWPGCPFKIYLLSNLLMCNQKEVETIIVGPDVSWSDNLKRALKKINESYVLLFLDDLLLYEAVDSQKVMDILNWAVTSNVNYIRLNPMNNGPDKPYNKFAGILSRGMIYRTSTVMAVWKKNILFDLLKPGESAWQFENAGSIRSDNYDDFYATRENCFSILNSVIKGKWQRRAIRVLNSLGIKYDLNKRAVMTRFEATLLYLKIIRSRLLSLLPARYRRNIRSVIWKVKHKYGHTI